MKIDILLTIKLCNVIDAPHKSARQNFNFSFYLGFNYAMFLKNLYSCF